AFDLVGAFSSVAVKLLDGTQEGEVIERIDALGERYCWRGAHGLADQHSHSFFDAELQQLQALSAVLPSIFMLASAFLVNMTLTRLVALEREQIGLMKALGYGSAGVAWHYLKFVIAIGVVGIVIGVAAGTWLGNELAALYVRYFNFPYLVFRIGAATYVIATGVTVLAAMVGAVRAVWGVASLSPAVAMQPAAPTRYRRIVGGARLRWLPQTSFMIVRHIARWPLRAAFTLLGIALSVAVLVVSLCMEDAVDSMVDTIFFQADRQNATISFVNERPVSVVSDIARLPGVMAVEPVRMLAVRITSGPVSRR